MSDVFRRAGGWFARQRTQPATEPRPDPATAPRAAPAPAPAGGHGPGAPTGPPADPRREPAAEPPADTDAEPAAGPRAQAADGPAGEAETETADGRQAGAAGGARDGAPTGAGGVLRGETAAGGVLRGETAAGVAAGPRAEAGTLETGGPPAEAGSDGAGGPRAEARTEGAAGPRAEARTEGAAGPRPEARTEGAGGPPAEAGTEGAGGPRRGIRGRRLAVPRGWRPGGDRDGGGSAAIQVAPGEERGATAETATKMEPRQPGESPTPPPEGPLLQRSTVVAGIYAWSFVGLAIVTLGVLYVLQFFGVVVFPLILALFPAALLVGPTRWLKRYLPNALATLLVLLGFLAVFSALVAVLIPSVMQELTSEGGIVEQLETGFAEVQRFLADGPFGFQPVQVDDLLQQAQEQIAGAAQLAPQVLSAAGALVEGFAGLLFGTVALFFYLKDGESIGNFLRDLFPERWRSDAVQIGKESWETVGGYIRGQLIVGLVDGVLIGIGLAVIGVPLVIPLAVITFIGGLFPIIGATVAGIIAVIVALATGGPSDALLTAILVFAVQQVEGDLLAPVVLGRATQLHPLAILGFLAAGGILGGILGAFLAVPVGASLVRAVGHIRHRIPG